MASSGGGRSGDEILLVAKWESLLSSVRTLLILLLSDIEFGMVGIVTTKRTRASGGEQIFLTPFAPIAICFRSDVNRLVMDYLVIEGYKDAAQRFSSESGLSPQVDLESIQNRMTIRGAVQRGDIEDAIGRVNELDPEVSWCKKKFHDSSCTPVAGGRTRRQALSR